MQRLAKFSKNPEPAAPAFASVSSSDIIRAPVVPRAIPLEFAPLLAPYKRHGRLSLRVEEVPQQARLSAGRNNGDGSWSLASDELEGLAYLIPPKLDRDHTLLLRIMAFEEGAASTLKLLHFPVPVHTPVDAVQETPASAESPDPILHHELNRMQSLFAVRDSELTELRAALEQAKTAKDAELTSARGAWELELRDRLSEAVGEAKSGWQREQSAGQTAQDKSVAQVKTWAEQQIAEEHVRWQAQTEQRLEAERQRWKTESAGALSQAVAEERKHWQAQAEQRIEAERQRWKTESAEALSQAIAEERKQWQAQTEQRGEIERDRWESESASILSGAVAEERQRSQVLTEQRIDAERQRWKAESATALSQVIAEERRQWQAQTEQRVAVERERWAAENLGVLSQAEARWKAEEAARLEAALGEWREQSSRLLADASQKYRDLESALAEARARPSNPAAIDEPESDRLRGELTRMQSILAERDSELARQRTALEQERERWRQDLDASMSVAAKAWKADEDARLAAMVARSRTQSDAALAVATSRYEAAERALAEAGSRNAAALKDLDRKDDSYVEGLRRELSTVQAILVSREVELGRAKAALERARPPQNPISNPVLARNIADSDEEEAPTGSKRGLVRDFVVAVCVIAPVIFFYPRLEIYLPDELRASITTMTGGLLGTGATPVPLTQAAAPPALPVPKLQIAQVGRAVNLRATAATTGAVVLTLQRGAPVNVLKRQGNWTFVEVPAKIGKPLQGFVYSSYLNDPP
jgi:hypothetical protein